MASDREYSTILVEGELYQTQFDRIWELGLEGVAEDSRVKHCKGIQRYTLSNGFLWNPVRRPAVIPTVSGCTAELIERYLEFMDKNMKEVVQP